MFGVHGADRLVGSASDTHFLIPSGIENKNSCTTLLLAAAYTIRKQIGLKNLPAREKILQWHTSCHAQQNSNLHIFIL
jgi:hypothetical protein